MDDDSNSSRKRKAGPAIDDDDGADFSSKVSKMSDEGQEVSYTLKNGKLRSDGKIQGATLHVQGTKSFTVESGEAILLLKLADPDATEATPHPAVVVGFYSQDEGQGFTIRVRWLITAAELQALPADFVWRGLDRDNVLKDMGENDVILSPQIDDLPVQSIVAKASVKIHWSDDDDASPKEGKPLARDAPPGILICQYQLTLDDDNALHLDYARHDTANDLEGTGSRMNLSSTRGSHSSLESQSLTGNRGESSDEDDDAADASDEDEKRVVAEGEGSNLRTSIAVGPAYQATVPRFQPNAKDTVSRRPAKLVWKPGAIPEEALAEYLEKAAAILNGYLRSNLLTSTEPYSPMPNERAEALLKENPDDGALTGSSLSTASVLSSVRRNALLKECDVDRLLARIHDTAGDVSKALELVKQEPARFITTWAQFEKEMFNDNFRRHHGAVRKIAKSVAPFKTIQEVIDYQYRFKIPDQFRLYQERKREIAARIVDCIDHRRVVDPTADTRKRPLGSSVQRWSESTPNDVARATEDRREKAKQLMIYANDVLGKSTIGQVANAIKELNRADTPSARAALFNLLHGHTDLQRRFNEFLPKQV